MSNSATPEKKQPKTGSTSAKSVHGSVPFSKPRMSKDEKTLKQRNITLAKLNLDPADIDRAPQISAILAESDVSVDTAIQAMRFSNDPNITEFMKAYDEASITDRLLLPLEAFAVMAGVNIKALLGALVVELRDRSANIVKAILTDAHPDVTRASVRNALKPGGVKDRNAIHTAMRLLPVSKGATILIPNLGQLPQGAEMEIDGDDVDTEALFPNLETTQKMLEG